MGNPYEYMGPKYWEPVRYVGAFSYKPIDFIPPDRLRNLEKQPAWLEENKQPLTYYSIWPNEEEAEEGILVRVHDMLAVMDLQNGEPVREMPKTLEECEAHKMEVWIEEVNGSSWF
jgi:hypothetical protein